MEYLNSRCALSGGFVDALMLVLPSGFEDVELALAASLPYKS